MNKGVSLNEIILFFDALKQSKKNNDIQILINNGMCKELQNMIEAVFIKQKKQDKEIKRLNKKYEDAVADYEEQKYIINELEKYMKENPFYYSIILDKLKELKEGK